MSFVTPQNWEENASPVRPPEGDTVTHGEGLGTGTAGHVAPLASQHAGGWT